MIHCGRNRDCHCQSRSVGASLFVTLISFAFMLAQPVVAQVSLNVLDTQMKHQKMFSSSAIPHLQNSRRTRLPWLERNVWPQVVGAGAGVESVMMPLLLIGDAVVPVDLGYFDPAIEGFKAQRQAYSAFQETSGNWISDTAMVGALELLPINQSRVMLLGSDFYGQSFSFFDDSGNFDIFSQRLNASAGAVGSLAGPSRFVAQNRWQSLDILRSKFTKVQTPREVMASLSPQRFYAHFMKKRIKDDSSIKPGSFYLLKWEESERDLPGYGGRSAIAFQISENSPKQFFRLKDIDLADTRVSAGDVDFWSRAFVVQRIALTKEEFYRQVRRLLMREASYRTQADRLSRYNVAAEIMKRMPEDEINISYFMNTNATVAFEWPKIQAAAKGLPVLKYTAPWILTRPYNGDRSDIEY